MIEKEFILCAAIHYDNGVTYSKQPENIKTGFIITGRRHKDCYTTIEAILSLGTFHNIVTPDRENQGFITSTNRYVNRAEAFKIAKANNQIYHKMFDDTDEGILTSEDLY